MVFFTNNNNIRSVQAIVDDEIKQKSMCENFLPYVKLIMN